MIYPLNNVRFEVEFERGADGGLRACGVAITDPEGWIEVPMPARAVGAGAPPVVSLHVRLQRGAGGRSYVDADRLVARGEHYRTLAELLAAGAAPWLAEVGPAFDAEVERRIRESPRVRSGYHRRADADADANAGEGEAAMAANDSRRGGW